MSLARLKRSILSWPMCVPLNEYSDIPDIIDTKTLVELGEGSFGKVFKAQLLEDAYGLPQNSEIALKELDLKKISESDRTDADDLKTEILAMSKLSGTCPDYVAGYYDIIFAKNDDMLYILMELIDGQNLNRHPSWKKENQFKTHEKIARTLAKGLKCLHDNSIAHRDIKPENVVANTLLSVLKWVDLGFSCVTFCKLNQDPKKVGTALFWAPEITNGTIDNSLRSWQFADIYSFGLLLHEMCGGEVKIDGKGELVGNPASSDSVFVDGLIKICLIVNPDDRYNAWEDFTNQNL